VSSALQIRWRLRERLRPDYVLADALFSIIRLRGIGFQFRYPTLEEGLHQIFGTLNE
jgi:hypothetical protein